MCLQAHLITRWICICSVPHESEIKCMQQKLKPGDVEYANSKHDSVEAYTSDATAKAAGEMPRC